MKPNNSSNVTDKSKETIDDALSERNLKNSEENTTAESVCSRKKNSQNINSIESETKPKDANQNNTKNSSAIEISDSESQNKLRTARKEVIEVDKNVTMGRDEEVYIPT
jgi:hypothetical protein